MRAILAGGGTGGHIYPALAIADTIRRKQPDSDILFIGGRQGMERDIVPAHGYEMRVIEVRGFSRKNPFQNAGTVLTLLRACGQIRRILKEFRPDVVIGTGGYVAGPVVREAGRMGLRAFIHEQNAFPGLANKMAAKYAETIFLAFEEGKRHFRQPEKILVTGNPIRRAFLTAGVAAYREKLGVGAGDFVILCFGGSRGAKRINESMTAILGALWRETGVRVYFVTGNVYYETAVRALSEAGVPLDERLCLLAYTDRMHRYMAAADLIISRSGALTVSEITACAKPSILIPSPNVTDNHQYFNAKTVADRGGALLLPEAELTPERLLDAILRLKNNKRMLNDMSAACGSLARTDAAGLIYDRIAGAQDPRYHERKR
jgi:UDP-N-acetylglucosamine--N-acetylmuramyl-(pentapeptide) pyrophosphoryl-undecaprenol N-acetylglucosamine transferase